MLFLVYECLWYIYKKNLEDIYLKDKYLSLCFCEISGLRFCSCGSFFSSADRFG